MGRYITLFLIIALFFSGTVSPVYANNRGNIDELKKEISELEKMIKLLNEDIDNRLKRIEELEKELVYTEREMKRNEEKLAQAQQRYEEILKHFAGRVRSAYMKGGASYIEILLDAESFGELIIRLAYLRNILNRDALLVSGIREERDEINNRQLAMEKQRKIIEDRRYQMQAERLNLEEQRKALNKLLNASKENLAEELAALPQAESKPIYGVVYDNHPKARPQHGLAKASVVYEYEVEGLITRYLALFADLPTKVGPIRSAREHSTMLAWENGVNFISAGGSKDNLDRIAQWGVSYTNALAHPAFYRDSSRSAPHNLYVNLATLNRATPSGERVIRPGNLSRKGQPANTITISYSNTYKVIYQYDREKKAYKRLINDVPHKDATGEEIWARNVIIQYTAHPTDIFRRPTPEVVGEGVIDFYAMGQHFRGKWVKESPSSPTRFFYEDGQEIERIYGQTWIQIARP
ncbi:DUF3048 domain-containing protein [Anaerobranca gottschalkii]|uniref:N-terminal domain of peptidoglycan hydrolase CwlO-containing protein n=1 Tax=Anaerobranca gottschalkii DSM 13577 TaxID=1120990 RepID=A0A1H9Z190_9FIRM|nr:DUF3048 domain-containing protein [Anaerobranca gottschalkii]SES75271.1 N-terminal domain of peptidoglycan hydrolase CwlO-containing protein [Anaerobranca gottschalkii DSM 13577]